MKSRVWSRFWITAIAILLVFALGPRITVTGDVERKIDLPPCEDLAEWISEREEQVANLREGVEAQVIYAHPNHRKTPLSIVYIHGFSSSRKDLEPIPQLVAKSLGANLYLARLTAHGRTAEEFANVSADQWLQDSIECLRIGNRLGDRVIVMGHSTGALLAAWSALGEESIAGAVLLSPNFGVANKSARLARLPWGRVIVRLVLGKYRSIPDVKNELHEKYWTTTYRSHAIGELLALVPFCKEAIRERKLPCPVLCVYSRQDIIVDLAEMKSTCQQIQTPMMTIKELPNSPGHELAGEILAPKMTQPLLEMINQFLNDQKIARVPNQD